MWCNSNGKRIDCDRKPISWIPITSMPILLYVLYFPCRTFFFSNRTPAPPIYYYCFWPPSSVMTRWQQLLVDWHQRTNTSGRTCWKILVSLILLAIDFHEKILTKKQKKIEREVKKPRSLWIVHENGPNL